MGKVSSFLRMPAAEKALVLQAFILLPFCHCCVRLFPFRIIVNLFSLQQIDGIPQFHLSENDKYSATLVGWSITRTGRLPFFANSRCLARALAGRFLLKQKKLPAILTIGTNLQNETMTAHAWLQCGELIVTGEAEHQKYRAIVSFM